MQLFETGLEGVPIETQAHEQDMASNSIDAAELFPLDATNLRQRSVNGTIVTVISQIIRAVMTTVSLIWLSRLLLPTDFGLLAIVAPVTGFVALLSNAGFFQAIVQAPRISIVQMDSLFWIGILMGALFTLLFLASAPIISILYNNKQVLPIMLALSATIVFSSVASMQTAVLNRTMAFLDIALVEVSALFCSVFASIVLAKAGCGYWALVAGQVINPLTTALLVWILSPWRPSKIHISFKQTKEMLYFGGNLSISNIAVYLNINVDNIIVGAVLGIAILGVYDRAWKLAVISLSQLLAPVSRVAFPILSRLHHDEARYRLYFKILLQGLLCLTGPGLVAAILSAPVTVPSLLGARWHGMAPVFQWLCFAGMLSPINNAAVWLFISQGRAQEQTRYVVAVIGINLASYAVGVVWGLDGVVAASAISSYLLQTPILLFGALKKGPIGFHDIVGMLAMPALCTGVIALACTISWFGFVPRSFAGALVLFAEAYFALAVSLMLSSDGRLLLSQVRSLLVLRLVRRPHALQNSL